MMKLYRKEPLLGFALTIGAVDAAIGGLRGHSGLVTIGLGLLGMALGMWLWQTQNRPPRSKRPERRAKYLLPPAPSRSDLSPLHLPKKSRPNAP
jgi:hypothetical protein